MQLSMVENITGVCKLVFVSICIGVCVQWVHVLAFLQPQEEPVGRVRTGLCRELEHVDWCAQNHTLFTCVSLLTREQEHETHIHGHRCYCTHV